jgi:hypothetical protein
MPKFSKCSKNIKEKTPQWGGMTKRHTGEVKRVLNGQRWNNLSNKINKRVMNISESILIQTHNWINEWITP